MKSEIKKVQGVRSKRVTKKRKPRWDNRIKPLLIAKGKSEKWFIDELKIKFKINKSMSKDLLEGYEYLSITSTRIPVCIVLDVGLNYFKDIQRF